MTQPADDPRQVKLILELIEHTVKLAELNERGDLAERLTNARERISDPQIRVVIAGQLKQGKSQLVNCLVNGPVARVGDDESTALATVVTYGERSAARLIVSNGENAEPDVIEISPDDIKKDLRRAPEAGGRQVIRLEVNASTSILKSGLAFVDTPGVGGHGQPHLSATLGLMPDADAVIMVSDLSQEFTSPEMIFMRQAFDICPVAAIALPKTDLYPHWREILAANNNHLQRAGLHVPLIPVSSLLRNHAVQLNDKELNDESNYPAIFTWLTERVLSRENDRVKDQVVADIRSAAEHLTLSVSSELEAINDPDARERLKDELERRKEEAQEALQQSALWQQVLNDGIADLTGDVDHDMRARFRAVMQHFEEVIDGCDPTHHWAEIGNDIEEAVATAVGDNFVWAYQRSEALAAEVARTFTEAGLESVKMPEIRAQDMAANLTGLKSLAKLEAKPVKAGHKVMTGMRGGYGGMLMFGMMTSMAGLGMFNPLSLAAGALMGRKAYKEDLENRMMRMRGEAKMNMRRFVDDISFVVSKESRDRLKLIQRQLRDHYRDVANQTTRSLNESLQATIAAARMEESEQNSRIQELQRQLHILNQVSDHASKLAGAVAKDAAGAA